MIPGDRKAIRIQVLLLVAILAIPVHHFITVRYAPDTYCRPDFSGIDSEIVIKACTRIIESAVPENKSNVVAAYSIRGLVHAFENQFTDAFKDLNKAIALNPKIDGYYRARAKSHEKLGQLQRSIDDYSRAISLLPRNGYYDARADLYEKLGQFDNAFADLIQAGYQASFNFKMRPALSSEKLFKLNLACGRGIEFPDKEEYDRAVAVYREAARYAHEGNRHFEALLAWCTGKTMSQASKKKKFHAKTRVFVRHPLLTAVEVRRKPVG